MEANEPDIDLRYTPAQTGRGIDRRITGAPTSTLAPSQAEGGSLLVAACSPLPENRLDD